MRSLLLAALVLAAAPFASSQVTFGVKGGLNTTFFSGPSSDGLDPKLGAVGGITTRFDVNPGFGIGAEVLYSQKGARDEVVDETYSFDYIEIPAYVRLAVPIGELLDGGVTLGGYAGIPVRTSVTDRDTDIDANLDYGALIGVDLGAGPYYVEGRYSLGLAQVSDSPQFGRILLSGSDGFQNGDLADLKNQAVSFTFGVRFGGPRY